MEADALGGSNTINVPAGTYTLSIPQSAPIPGEAGELDVTSGTVTINGAGAGSTIVNAAQLDRVFQVGSNATADIVGLTLTDGSAQYGSGILNRGTLTVSNCTITANGWTRPQPFADEGGGIYNEEGKLTVLGSTISGNTADVGAGISNYYFSTLTVANSTISANKGTLAGGGIDNYLDATLSLTNSTISNNTLDSTVNSSGGGITNGSTATITNCTISGNSAEDDGGIGGAGTLTMSNCAISGNIAASRHWRPRSRRHGVHCQLHRLRQLCDELGGHRKLGQTDGAQ